MSTLAAQAVEEHWSLWLEALFPNWFWAPYAAHHCSLWEWAWSIKPYEEVDPYVAIWSRGHAKSTNAEGVVTMTGARETRRYWLYVCDTQDQADDHVANIAALIEGSEIEGYYPDFADRAMGKYGAVKAWRRNRLWCANGFIVDALGLDTAARGLKILDQRPDGCVLDDIDTDFDTPDATRRKLRSISHKVLPALTADAAVLGVQNLIIRGGVFGQLADLEDVPRTDVLNNRIVSGPIPAVEHLEYEARPEGGHVITAGTPTWAGEPIEALQRELDTIGISAFLGEKQHDEHAVKGELYGQVTWRRIAREHVPHIKAWECWCDPAVTDTDRSDSCAIQLDGLGSDDVIYRFFSWERRAGPRVVVHRAILVAVEYGCPSVGIETDQGGDTWYDTWELAQRDAANEHPELEDAIMGLRMKTDKAGKADVATGRSVQSKTARQHAQLADYERGRIVHVVGTHDVLERALERFGAVKPYDLGDASFWSHHHLRHLVRGPAKVRSGASRTLRIPEVTRQG